MNRPLVIRWTVGDVKDQGFEALALSIRGAWKIFGQKAKYTVCCNSIFFEHLLSKIGELPANIVWHESTLFEIPDFVIWIRDLLMVALGIGDAQGRYEINELFWITTEFCFWEVEGRPAVEHIRANWYRHRDEIRDLVWARN